MIQGSWIMIRSGTTTEVIETAVRVTTGWSESFLFPKPNLIILKIFGYCYSRV